MLLKSNTAVHRRAIGVHIEDGKENADAFTPRFQKFFFVDFLNIGDCAVCRRDHSALIAGIWPVGDFRFRPGNMGVTYILIAIAIASAVVPIPKRMATAAPNAAPLEMPST